MSTLPESPATAPIVLADGEVLGDHKIAEVLDIAAKNSPGALKLMAQLLGVAACPGCDYLQKFCRCAPAAAPAVDPHAALRALCVAAKGWNWNAVKGDQFGRLDDDDHFSDIGTIDANQYGDSGEDLNAAVLAYIVGSPPDEVLRLLDAIAELRAKTEVLYEDRPVGYHTASAHAERATAAKSAPAKHSNNSSSSSAPAGRSIGDNREFRTLLNKACAAEVDSFLDESSERLSEIAHAAEVALIAHIDADRARIAQSAPAVDRFFMDHGMWHDRQTGQHMYNQDEYDERYRDGLAVGKENAELGISTAPTPPAQPAPALSARDADDTAEAAQVLDQLIASVTKHGNYSTDATLAFLGQIRQCLSPSNPAAPGESR